MYNVYSTYIILYDIYHRNHRKYKNFTSSIHILTTVHIFFFYLINNESEKLLSYNILNIIAASLFLPIVKGMVVSVQTSINSLIKQAYIPVMFTYNTQDGDTKLIHKTQMF